METYSTKSTDIDATALNRQFGIPERLAFAPGKGGLVMATLTSPHAVSTVSLYGGQVMSYRPLASQEDVLFQSERAFYETGKAIKGGIPLCWPWFGPDPEGASRPAHGFARISPWQVLESGVMPNGATRLVLGLSLTAKTRALWVGDIEAQLEIEVGEALGLRLTTSNHSDQPITISQAFHTYFKVGDISQVVVAGLEDKTYIDKLDASREKHQSGELRISAETDRIYQQVSNDLSIRDAGLNRRIEIQSSGSRSAVVWNPWQQGSAKMADLDNEDYRHFICVETANAGEDVVTIPARERHAIEVRYQVLTT